MSFALLIIGITLIVAAVRDTQRDLISLLYGDFTGQGNFWFWIAAILIIGAVGYIPRLKPISDGFLVIVLLVLVLSKGDPKKNAGGGFFKMFTEALAGTTQAAAPNQGVADAITGAIGGVTGRPGAPAANRGSGPDGSWTAQDKIEMSRQPVSCPAGMTYQGPLLGCR